MPLVPALPPATMSSPTPKTAMPFSIVPATDLPAGVHLGLTVFLTIVYAALFITIYIQLFRLLYYQHKRLSYQSVFLFVCLVWAALRIDLFAFYYKNVRLATTLPRGWYFTLYALPVCLQYVTLTLLVLYFCRVSEALCDSLRLSETKSNGRSCCLQVYLKTRERAENSDNSLARRQHYRTARCVLQCILGRIYCIALLAFSDKLCWSL